MTLIRVIDTETSGLGDDAEVCEVAFCDVMAPLDSVPRGEPSWCVAAGACLVKVSRPMPPEAQAIHHIDDETLAEYGQEFPVAWAYMLRPEYSPGGWDASRPMAAPHDQVYAYAAHHADFDSKLIGKQWTGGAPWICTRKCAMRAWPELPAFGNQVIRYAKRLVGALDPRASPTHAAAPDAYVTANILMALLAEHTVGELIMWSRQPAAWPRITFGKHKGTPWAEVDAGYLTWMIGARGADIDDWDNWRSLASAELKRRRVRVTSAAVK